MGLELGQRLGVTLIGRVKGKHFLVFSGADTLELDAALPESSRAVPTGWDRDT
jgi:FdhD protein